MIPTNYNESRAVLATDDDSVLRNFYRLTFNNSPLAVTVADGG